MKPFAFLTHNILAIGVVYFETPKSQTFSLSNLSTSFFLYFLEWKNAQDNDLTHFLEDGKNFLRLVEIVGE